MQKDLNTHRNDMIELLSDKYQLEGSVQSDIPNLDFFFSQNSTEQISIMYEPSLCVILQGKKSVEFGGKTFSYNQEEFLISSAHLPAKMKITEASNTEPYMSLRIKFSLEDIYELLKTLDLKSIESAKNAEQGLFFGDMNVELYDSIYRLINLLQRDPDDIAFLHSLITKEILYNLVKSKGGYFLTKFAMEGTVSNKIVKVISQIKENFNDKLNVKELADSIAMSESSLYQHFKTITMMSPIQFQKKLRLEEAKQLLTLRNMEISEVAFHVGYESPSQFSREFSRMFGSSPKAFLDQY